MTEQQNDIMPPLTNISFTYYLVRNDLLAKKLRSMGEKCVSVRGDKMVVTTPPDLFELAKSRVPNEVVVIQELMQEFRKAKRWLRQNSKRGTVKIIDAGGVKD